LPVAKLWEETIWTITGSLWFWATDCAFTVSDEVLHTRYVVIEKLHSISFCLNTSFLLGERENAQNPVYILISTHVVPSCQPGQSNLHLNYRTTILLWSHLCLHFCQCGIATWQCWFRIGMLLVYYHRNMYRPEESRLWDRCKCSGSRRCSRCALRGWSWWNGAVVIDTCRTNKGLKVDQDSCRDGVISRLATNCEVYGWICAERERRDR